jgi:hypothetical protein
MPTKKSTNLFDFRTLDQIPTGKIGDPITADWLNRGIEGVNRLIGNVDRAQQFIRPPTARPSEGAQQVISVVLRQAPVPPTGFMIIQRVGYETSPPSSFGSLVSVGSQFIGHMAFGRNPEDYSSFVYSGAEIFASAPFLFARREGALWLVDIPVQLEDKYVAVAIVEAPDAETWVMQVRRVKWHEFPPTSSENTRLNWQSAAFPARVDFRNKPEDYSGMLHPGANPVGGLPNPEKPILFARKEGVNWFVELRQKDQLTQFQVVDDFGDYFSAYEYEDGAVIEGTLTLIAKRWGLRRTPFHGNTIDGIEYTYENAYTRIAENRTEDKERQFVTPPYMPLFSIIWASKGPKRGTGVVTERAHGEIPAGAAVEWLAEVDGRHWAWDGEDINP